MAEAQRCATSDNSAMRAWISGLEPKATVEAAGDRPLQSRRQSFRGQRETELSIPTKAPGNYEIMAPIFSWMMPPPGNGMMAPGSLGLLADIFWRQKRRLVKSSGTSRTQVQQQVCLHPMAALPFRPRLLSSP